MSAIKSIGDSQSAAIAVLSSRLFGGMNKIAVNAILDAAQLRKYHAEHEITGGGSPATRLYLVQSGRARLYHLTRAGELLLIAWLLPGDVVGLVAALDTPPPYMATSQATCDCEVWSWDHSTMRKLVSSYPQLAENALRIAFAYLRIYIDRHVALVSGTAELRLAKTLLRLGEQAGQFRPDGIEIRATNDELAAFADISPYTASRVISNWDRTGVLCKGRGRVLLQAPEALMVD